MKPLFVCIAAISIGLILCPLCLHLTARVLPFGVGKACTALVGVYLYHVNYVSLPVNVCLLVGEVAHMAKKRSFSRGKVIFVLVNAMVCAWYVQCCFAYIAPAVRAFMSV